MPKVILWLSSINASHKALGDADCIRRILLSNKVAFEEVCCQDSLIHLRAQLDTLLLSGRPRRPGGSP